MDTFRAVRVGINVAMFGYKAVNGTGIGSSGGSIRYTKVQGETKSFQKASL